MIQAELEKMLTEELHKIAPELELELIDKEEDLREECDIDSVDFLNLLTAIGKRLNIAMPESDYQRLSTFNSMLAYLAEKTV